MAELLSTGLSIYRAMELGKKGFDHFTKEFPQYPAFWQPFSKRIQADKHIEWSQIERARFDFEFIGMALALMCGAQDARDRLATYFEYIEAKGGPWDTREEILERILDTAEVVANDIVSDEDRILIQRRLIEETVERVGEEGREHTIETVKKGTAEGKEHTTAEAEKSRDHLDKRIDELSAQIDNVGSHRDQQSIAEIEAIEHILEGWVAVDATQQQSLDSAKEKASNALERMRSFPPPPAVQTIDESALIEATNQGFRLGEEAERERHRMEARHQAEGSVLRPPAISAPIDPGSEAASSIATGDEQGLDDDGIEKHLSILEKHDPEAVEAIRRALAKAGHEGVVSLIGSDPVQSVEALVTEARIVQQRGFFAHAEEAYMLARDQADNPYRKARQLVRAASMARLQGEDERARALLDQAEEMSPGHPAVAIAEARESDDQEWVLARLDRVEAPDDKDEQALLHVARGQAHLGSGDVELAKTELQLAEEASAPNASVVEFKAIYAWMTAKATGGEGIERDELLNAARYFAEMVPDLEKQKRPEIASLVRARAAEAFALGEEPDKGARLLEEIEEPLDLDLDAREQLAEAAMLTRRPDLIPRFLSSRDSSEMATLLLADAALFAGPDSVDVSAAAKNLVALLESEDEGIRSQAAFALVSGSSMHLVVDWNEDAAAILAEKRPVIEAVMRAERKRIEGNTDAAEAGLLARATDPRVLRQLRDYAAQDGDWSKARDRSRQLFELTGDVTDRLAFADSSRRAGDVDTAEKEFLAIARAADNPPSVRSTAYGGAMEMIGGDRNFTAIRDLAREWHDALPDDPNGQWNLLFGLTRLAAHDEAYLLEQEEHPEADTAERASLLAEILLRAAPKLESMQRIAELSDHFNRKVEGLEAFFLQASLGAEQSGVEIPSVLIERTKETWANFLTRFPDTKFLQVFEAPSTAEGFAELMRELGATDDTGHREEAYEAVIAGTGPVNAVAALSPNAHLGRTWLRIGFLPLGFALDDHDEADRKTAATALGGGAVWDASAIFVSGCCGKDHEERTLGALPGSVVAHETLEDCDQGQSSAPTPGQMKTIFDPDSGKVGLRKLTDDEVSRERYMAEGVLDLARRLRVEPGSDGKFNSKLTDLLHESPDTSWGALTASLAVAERLDMPVFSDDRWIRMQARSMGIQAFGTAALLDVMAERGVISEDERRGIRKDLIRNNAWGLQPTRAELIELGEKGQWDVSPGSFGGLNDRAAWRAQPVLYWIEVLGFLEAAFKAQPETFREWLLRSIDSFRRAVPEYPAGGVVELLLLSAWPFPGRDESLGKECFQQLVNEVDTLPLWSPTRPDPLATAINQLLSFFSGEPTEARIAIFRQIIAQLEWKDQLAAYIRFVNWE